MTEATKIKISIANKGKIRSEVTKKKLSIAHQGKKQSKETIEKRKISMQRFYDNGGIGYWKGKNMSDKSNKKRSIALKGKNPKNLNYLLSLPRTIKWRQRSSEAQKGEKHWNWKGGITLENRRERNSIAFKLWREAVFARDNWTCKKCGVVGNNLVPHHIKNFAQWLEFRFVVNNGITFCEKCHRKFHKKYSTKDNNKEQIIEFLLNKCK